MTPPERKQDALLRHELANKRKEEMDQGDGTIWITKEGKLSISQELIKWKTNKWGNPIREQACRQSSVRFVQIPWRVCSLTGLYLCASWWKTVQQYPPQWKAFVLPTPSNRRSWQTIFLPSPPSQLAAAPYTFTQPTATVAVVTCMSLKLTLSRRGRAIATWPSCDNACWAQMNLNVTKRVKNWNLKFFKRDFSSVIATSELWQRAKRPSASAT